MSHVGIEAEPGVTLASGTNREKGLFQILKTKHGRKEGKEKKRGKIK